MAERGKAWIWVALVSIALVGASLTAIGNFVTKKSGAEEACAAHFSGALQQEVKPQDVRTTRPEVYFPAPLQKRFRCDCSYDGTIVRLESSPFGDWQVVEGEGLH